MERFLTKHAWFAYIVWLALFRALHLLPFDVNGWMIVGAWLILVSMSFPLFVVFVPEVIGLVMLNKLTGKMNSRGPGFNFRYPWEAVRTENFFSLELVTKEFKQSYASKNGPMMLVEASYQYAPDSENLARYITVDETTIQRGFTDVLSSLLSSLISGLHAEEARTEIITIQELIESMFIAQTVKIGNDKTSLKDKLEHEYGISFKLLAIADIDFSEDYQQTRSAGARIERIGKMTKNLAKELDITGKDAANLVMVEQGKIKKNVFEVEGLAGALADIVKKFFEGGK